MNIFIICVGKLKETYLKQAIEEYSKRLSRYCKLTVLQVADEKTPDSASAKEELQIKEKEGMSILKNIKDNMFVVALDLKGEMLSSEGLSNFIENCSIKGDSNIAFVIGGSLGLSNEVLTRSNYRLCFSKMTFPHQLMRVMLLEQIYRAYRIINNEPYHK